MCGELLLLLLLKVMVVDKMRMRHRRRIVVGGHSIRIHHHHPSIVIVIERVMVAQVGCRGGRGFLGLLDAVVELTGLVDLDRVVHPSLVIEFQVPLQMIGLV
jgi:hypothetical protein